MKLTLLLLCCSMFSYGAFAQDSQNSDSNSDENTIFSIQNYKNNTYQQKTSSGLEITETNTESYSFKVSTKSSDKSTSSANKSSKDRKYFPSNEIAIIYETPKDISVGLDIGLGAAIKSDEKKDGKKTIAGFHLGHWDMQLENHDEKVRLGDYKRDIIHVFYIGSHNTDGGMFSLREFDVNDKLRFQGRSGIRINPTLVSLGNYKFVELNLGGNFGKSFARHDFYYGADAQLSLIEGLIDLRGNYLYSVGKAGERSAIDGDDCQDCKTASATEYIALVEVGEKYGVRGELSKLIFHLRDIENFEDIKEDKYKVEAFFKF